MHGGRVPELPLITTVKLVQAFYEFDVESCLVKKIVSIRQGDQHAHVQRD